MCLCVCMSVWVWVGVHVCTLVGHVCVAAEEAFKKERNKGRRINCFCYTECSFE